MATICDFCAAKIESDATNYGQGFEKTAIFTTLSNRKLHVHVSVSFDNGQSPDICPLCMTTLLDQIAPARHLRKEAAE